MNIVLKTAAAVAMLASFSAPAFGQAVANGTGNANIIAPLAISPKSGTALNFGTVAVAAGTVTVAPNASGTRTGTLANVGSSSTSAQFFTVTGDGNRAFTAQIGTLTLAGPQGATAPTVTLSNNLSSNVGTLASGTMEFAVGGTLTVAADTTPGAYTGQFTATVTYN